MRRFLWGFVLCSPFVLWFLAAVPWLVPVSAQSTKRVTAVEALLELSQSEPVSYRVIKASREGTIEKEINALVPAGCYPILAAGGSGYDNEVTVILECNGRVLK